MAESDTILQLGIEAAREGNREEARNLFGLLTRQEPDNVQAWLWLAGVADGPDQRRAALERVVALDPTNEMAVKGLQAMGVSPTVRLNEAAALPPAPAPAPTPASSARQMTDEERYAMELDSAFDDYDTVPKTEAPRVELEPDLTVSSSAAPPRSASSQMTSRERATEAANSRRATRERSESRRTTTPIISGGDDMGMRPASGQSGLMRILIGGIVAVVVIFILWFGISRFLESRNQTANNGGDLNQPTQTINASNVLTPTLESGLVPTPADLGEVPTETIIDTLPLTDTLQPTAVPPAGDLAGANPAPVAVDTILETNGWSYSFPGGVCGVTCAAVVGPQGAFTPQGAYVLVLTLVANNTGTDQPVPADFFVLKDAQGNVYQALPQVSSAYVQPGINADLGMEAAVPANGVLTSVPIIFDVPHGATNLVLFARGKTDQGWQVLDVVP